jgi:hypothetical protein
MAFQNANPRTIDIERLFVRDIVFKDQGNRPISANQFLLTRGDGGIYFGNASTGVGAAFNQFVGSTIFSYTASNAFNTLWFEPGNGITFGSNLDGLQPKFYIAANAPQQIQVKGDGTLKFSQLPDDVSSGKTLVFAGSNELAINVSDNMLVFYVTLDSTISSITQLQSTTLGLQQATSTLQSQTSTLQQDTSTLQGYANIFYVSTAVSSFYSSLLFSEACCISLSTFVHSTFQVSSSYLNITYPQTYISSLTVDQLIAPNLIAQQLSTFSTIYWSSAFGQNNSLSSATISTIGTPYNPPTLTFDVTNQRIGVNLGMTQPRTAVDVSGIVFANNFVTASDRRLKKDVRPLSLPVKGLPTAYEYKWISNDVSDIGFLADEVEAVAPSCVFTDDAGYKAVNYGKLVPLCFAALKELQSRVSALEDAGKSPQNHACSS